MNLNASPSPFPIEQINLMDHDDQHHQHPFGPNIHHQVNYNIAASSSSSSVSCHIFFDPKDQDQTRYHHHQPPHPQEDDIYSRQGRSYEIKNKVHNGSLKLTLWKKKEDEGAQEQGMSSEKNNPVKWMSSKMRLMQKMKNNPDHNKLHRSSSFESTDQLSSNGYSSYTNNSPIRVCADCNTTKTPLWRSGPKGPKSLCNACGIRQRKARRAMAAAATASGTVVDSDHSPPAPKIKVQQKEKTTCATKNVHFKKRYKMANASSSSSNNIGQKKKIGGFEDFLINLSNNLSLHRVFPEEEKDAAILLMALSSGLVNG